MTIVEQQQQMQLALLRNIASKLNHLGTSLLHVGQYDDALVMYQEACSALTANLNQQQNGYCNSQECAIQRGVDCVVFGEEKLTNLQASTGNEAVEETMGQKSTCSSELGPYANTRIFTRPIEFITASNAANANDDLTFNRCNLSVTLYNIGLVHDHQNAYYTAEQFFTLALKASPEGCCCASPAVYGARNNLGHIAYMLEKYDDATVHFSESLRIVQKVSSSLSEGSLSRHVEDMIRRDHLVVLTNHALTMFQVGETFENHEMLDEAMLVYANIADNWGRSSFKENRQWISLINDIPYVLVFSLVFNRIGNIHYRKGELSLAIRAFERTKSMWVNALGDGHRDVETLTHDIGVLYWEVGKLNEAIHCFQDCLARRQALYGSLSMEVAEVLYEIGKIDQDRGQCESALSLYRNVVQVEKRILGSSHPDVAVTLNNIGQCLRSLNRLDHALKVYKEVLVMVRAAFGEEHPRIAEIQNAIGTIHMDMGDTLEAEKAFADAQRVEGLVASIQTQEHQQSRILWEETIVGHCAPAA